MNKLFPLVFLLLICFGCGDDPSGSIIIPDSIEIDLNQDGLVDFQITYRKISAVAPVDPDPGPYDIILGEIFSQNNTQLLKNEGENSILFLRDVDLVKNNISPPLFWEENDEENSSLLVSISQDISEKTWPEKWRIQNYEVLDSYLVGFKLSNDANSLGFFELSIDDETGFVEILRVEFI
ncbi:MAG: hypothetical protein P1U56_26310 [Saprospiraceae bacterium]|nr:hypothetical protein [Saprospiraceae bacterium]